MKKLLAVFLILILTAGLCLAAPEKGAPEKDKAKKGFGDYFSLGGPFVIVLFILSIVGLGFVIERMIVISRVKMAGKEFERKLLAAAEKGQIPAMRRICTEDNSETSRILLAGLNSIKKGPERVERVIEATAELQVSILERGLNILSSISHIAPLVGFLGTVSGMIGSFSAIASAENVSAKLVAGGIFEALITTAAGLIVAIPILVFHNFFVHRIDRFATDVERLTLACMEKLGEKGKL